MGSSCQTIKAYMSNRMYQVDYTHIACIRNVNSMDFLRKQKHAYSQHVYFGLGCRHIHWGLRFDKAHWETAHLTEYLCATIVKMGFRVKQQMMSKINIDVFGKFYRNLCLTKYPYPFDYYHLIVDWSMWISKLNWFVLIVYCSLFAKS